MSFPFVRRSAFLTPLAASLLLVACQTPPQARVEEKVAPPAAAASAPAAVAVPLIRPVEADPVALATRPPFSFQQPAPSPVTAMLTYADRVRPMSTAELAAELGRLGEPGDAPATQMQVALVLAQTRSSADLARALGLMQRVAANPSSDAEPLHPLARTLAARYLEQRRVEDDRDRQAQTARDNQRRIDQLNDRLEALRAIERSFARPNHTAPSNGNGGGTGTKPGP